MGCWYRRLAHYPMMASGSELLNYWVKQSSTPTFVSFNYNQCLSPLKVRDTCLTESTTLHLMFLFVFLLKLGSESADGISNSIFQINKSFTKHDGPAEWAAGLEDCCLPTLALTSLVHIQKETCGHSFSYKTSSIVSSFSADLRGLHCGIVGKTATCNAYILYRCHFVSQLLHL